MATNDSIDSAKVEQANELLSAIANAAGEIDRLCYHLGGDPEDCDALNTNINIMRTLVAHIGWMADLGCKKLTGQEEIKGDAEQWMMNPAYVKMLEAAEEVSHV